MLAVLYTNDKKEVDQVLDLINDSEDVELLQRIARVNNRNGSVSIEYELHLEIDLKN